MSGRSSRSTLMLTNSSFITCAVASSSKLSCAMTWHQWHAAYPTDSRIGLLARLASASASVPHGHQSTGLCLCWSRYGLVSRARRFSWVPVATDDIGSIHAWVDGLIYRCVYRRGQLQREQEKQRNHEWPTTATPSSPSPPATRRRRSR